MSVVNQGSPETASQVQSMFGAIAKRYDFLNSFLSLGIDKSWRDEAVKTVFEKDAMRILDVATGTADLALALKRERITAEVIGVDFAEPMLAIGRQKAAKEQLEVKLEPADGLNLPFPDASFDALTIAYGLRNFSNYQAGLIEFYRVLKPGGRLVILEFPPPPKGLFGQLFRFYFMRVLPLLGGLISGKHEAYEYLPTSVLNFPAPDVLATMMKEAGFDKIRYKLQTFGVSAIHVGDKS
ncbi:MAG: bifunctional demethylmenaquinone methyltransferase/2-methoxy-6-polyprenyl-1,4-benzoquinol methylase UbiE [Trueperaceae bacterium]|nr:bifunctional demethylmenaquinone methyltransferase/2-methoxy-6-polyprenyl-1,4-benzoquinol methylase UbiE [Trueperaceae bacterium]